MTVFPVVFTVLQLFLLIGVGVLIKRISSFGDTFFRNLSRFVVQVAIPLYLFTRISTTDAGNLASGWIFIAASTVITFFGFSAGWTLIRGRGINETDRKVGRAFTSFGNSGYFAISLTEIAPISLPVLAEKMGTGAPLLYIGAYLIIHNALLWSFGNYLITGRPGYIRVKEFFNPPFIGIVAGFAGLLLNVNSLIADKKMPWFYLFNALDALADVTMPLILICLGSLIADLKFRNFRSSGAIRLLFPVSLVRFFVFPAMFYLGYVLVFRPLGFTPAMLWVLFLETHTPPALNFSVMTMQAGVNEELSSSVLLGTYTLYLVLLPLFLVLFLSVTGF